MSNTSKEVHQINQNIMNNCAECKNTNCCLIPFRYKEPKKNVPVFVGLNPSFSIENIAEFYKKACETAIEIGKKLKTIDPAVFYCWDESDYFDSEIDEKIIEISHSDYPFFAPHRELAAVLNIKDWNHFDLFACRFTNADEVKKTMVKNIKNAKSIKDFGKKQLKNLNNLLISAEPTTIIFVNSFASQIYYHVNEDHLSFSEENGYHSQKIQDKDIPVFFSGMITGQRALDIFSRNRLYWQVAKVFGKNWSFRMP